MVTQINQNQSATEYVDTLIDKANDAEKKNIEEALKYSLEALELSKEHNLVSQEAKSHLHIGRCYWINGNFDEAVRHFNESLRICDEINETTVKAQTLIGLGNVYVTIEVLDQAVSFYNQALTIAQSNGLGNLAWKVYNNIGILHEDLKNYSTALEYFEKCLFKTLEIGDQYGQAIANINIANVYRSMGNLEESLRYVNEAIIHAKENHNTLLMAHAYHSIGLTYQKKAEYDLSIKYLLLGEKEALEIKDLYIMYRIDIELGNSYDLMNHFEDAEQFYKKALGRSKEIGMDELMPRIYEQMALFYQKHQFEDETLKYYQAYHKASKDVEENRRKERIKGIDYQSKLSVSLKETKVYRDLSNELQKSYESMHVLSTIGQSMTSTHNLNNILKNLYDNVNLLMDAEALAVGLYDENENVLRFDWYYEYGKKLDSFTLSLDNEKSWMIWSFKNRETVKINDIETEYKQYIKSFASTKGVLMHSAMYSPLIVEGEVIGVFSIQAKEKNAYTESHKDLLQTLGAYLAISIKNANKTKQLAILNGMLKTKSEHDGLTGIPNRRLFDEQYDKVWDQSLSHAKELSILMIDIDNFKEFNDQYGHLVGDEVVKSVAEILAKQKRTDDDFVARYGGDEFVAILPNTSKEEAIVFAETFQKCLLNVNKKLNIDIKVTVSVGVSNTIPDKKESQQALIYRADNQLYLSKANGKNRISAIHFD